MGCRLPRCPPAHGHERLHPHHTPAWAQSAHYALDQLFRSARSVHAFANIPVSDENFARFYGR